MKKFSLLFLMVSLLSFTACNSSDDAVTNQSQTAKQSANVGIPETPLANSVWKTSTQSIFKKHGYTSIGRYLKGWTYLKTNIVISNITEQQKTALRKGDIVISYVVTDKFLGKTRIVIKETRLAPPEVLPTVIDGKIPFSVEINFPLAKLYTPSNKTVSFVITSTKPGYSFKGVRKWTVDEPQIKFPRFEF